MRARHAKGLFVGALLALAGCHDPVTEVVLVVDTDLAVPSEVELMTIEIDGKVISRLNYELGPGDFPATLGLLPSSDVGDRRFDLSVSLFRRQGAMPVALVARRAAIGVRFVPGATKALFVPISRACACQGTVCPNPSPPACADLTSPMLTPFDPTKVSRIQVAGVPDGSVNELKDAAADSPTDVAGDAAGADAVDVSVETATDVSGDAVVDRADAADAPPAKLARGQTCTDGGACADGFCVDGVCCESACTCGTCGGAAPGHCVVAAAGMDPHAECGSFTCNGAGACETACTETFGACSARCASSAHCDGAGKCVPSTTEAGFFCIVGSCMCKQGLSCPAPDGGGAGRCVAN